MHRSCGASLAPLVNRTMIIVQIVMVLFLCCTSGTSSSIAGCTYFSLVPDFTSALSNGSFFVSGPQGPMFGGYLLPQESNTVVLPSEIQLIYNQTGDPTAPITSGLINPLNYPSINNNTFAPYGVMDFEIELSNLPGGSALFPTFRIEKKTPSNGTWSMDDTDTIFLSIAPPAAGMRLQVDGQNVPYDTRINGTEFQQSLTDLRFSFRFVWAPTYISFERVDIPVMILNFSGPGVLPYKPGRFNVYPAGNPIDGVYYQHATWSVYNITWSCLGSLSSAPAPTSLTCADPFATGTSSCGNDSAVVYYNGSQIISSNNGSVILPSKTIVNGDVSSFGPLEIVVTQFVSNDTVLSVSGCVDLKNVSLRVFVSQGNISSILLLETPCLRSNFTNISIISNYTCLRYQSGQASYDGTRLVIVFRPPQELKCHNGKSKRVLVIVLTASLFVIIIAAALCVWCYFYECRRGSSGLRWLFRAEDPYEKQRRRRVSSVKLNRKESN